MPCITSNSRSSFQVVFEAVNVFSVFVRVWPLLGVRLGNRDLSLLTIIISTPKLFELQTPLKYFLSMRHHNTKTLFIFVRPLGLDVLVGNSVPGVLIEALRFAKDQKWQEFYHLCSGISIQGFTRQCKAPKLLPKIPPTLLLQSELSLLSW